MKTIKSLILLLLFSGLLFSQKVTEKPINGIPKRIAPNAYDLKYDKKTGAYAYPDYDTVNDGVYLVTSKGKSEKYDVANTYSSVFDSEGNVYTLVYNRKNDSVNTYFILKNGVSLASFDNVSDNWTINGGYLYFVSKEGDKSYFNSLELSTSKIAKGKGYDDIVLTYSPDRFRSSHGEYVTYPGFTSEEKPFYIAYKDSTEAFLVIDGVEQKHYTDIDQAYISIDSSGNVLYVASSKGRIYSDSTDVFLVKGTTEYKHFNFVYGPATIDKSGNPVYVAGNKDNIKSHYPQVLMSGNNELSKWYDGGISDYRFLPSGKLAFIAGKYINDKDVETYVVIDDKEGKKHNSAYSLDFKPNGEAMFIEMNGNKQHLVINDEKVSNDFDNFLYYKYSGGKLFYAGTNYSPDIKKSSDKTFVFVEDEKLGPFEVTPTEDGGADTFFIVDDSGNYLLIGTKLINKKDYEYQEYVYTKNGKSGPYNIVSDFYLYKGRPIFVHGTYNDKNEAGSTNRVNIDMKDVTDKYDIISDFELDTKAGKVTFIGSKHDEIYYVEIAL